MDFLHKFFVFYRDALTANGPDTLTVFTYVGLGMILLGLFFYLKLCGIGSVKVYAELFNVKDGEIRARGHGHINGQFYPSVKIYFPGVKTPMYRYKYNGDFYVSTPLLVSNRASYNPLPGPCYIYINKKNPKHIYSPELKGVFHLLAGMGLAFMFLPFVIDTFFF